jgi:hypothetical protein
VHRRHDRLIEHLRERVGAQLSSRLSRRLEGMIRDAPDEDGALRDAIDKVRASLRLFVDESVADAVALELEQQLKP